MPIQADSAFVPSTCPSMDSGHASAYVETSAGQAGLHLQRHILREQTDENAPSENHFSVEGVRMKFAASEARQEAKPP